MHKPEIMSPAGYWPQLHAAIEAGADAVYFGLKHFTARAKVGFSLSELTEVMRTLHQRGRQGVCHVQHPWCLTMNWRKLPSRLRRLPNAGADALIVQDVGIANLPGKLRLIWTIHGSTQMSLTSAEGIRVGAAVWRQPGGAGA